MARYRKQPVEVEAAQWFPGVEIPGVYPPVAGELPHPYIRTAQQQVVFLAPGDWVVREPDGRGAYPVKPAIFAATYAPVVPAGAASTGADLQLRLPCDPQLRGLDQILAGLLLIRQYEPNATLLAEHDVVYCGSSFDPQAIMTPADQALMAAWDWSKEDGGYWCHFV